MSVLVKVSSTHILDPKTLITVPPSAKRKSKMGNGSISSGMIIITRGSIVLMFVSAEQIKFGTVSLFVFVFLHYA